MAAGRQLTTGEAQALFGHWRLILMGNRASRTPIPATIGGYFINRTDQSPVPLAELRRTLLSAANHAPLTDDERFVIGLYFGFHGLPLPYGSKRSPSISAGQDESTPRKVCQRALTKIAGCLAPRPLAQPVRRPHVDPLQQPWFRQRVAGRQRRAETVGRAFVRTVALCDGPHAKPTLVALHKWYRDCGYADPLLLEGNPPPGRPNQHALARAAALIELSLYEEIDTINSPLALGVTPYLRPVARSEPQLSTASASHPDLDEFTNGELSPPSLVSAAAALQTRACRGENVDRYMALLIRLLRPQVEEFSGWQLERLYVSISYVAATSANPFLALECLGRSMATVGITDRTFTILVNTIEAASSRNCHRLARQIDDLFSGLQRQWVLGPGQIPVVEHTEATQQHLFARSFRLQHFARNLASNNYSRDAMHSLEQSINTAVQATNIAQKVLADTRLFPHVAIEGKVGRHGGDLTPAWLLAAAARTMEAAAGLSHLANTRGMWTKDRRQEVKHVARLTLRVLPDCQDVTGNPGFDYWQDLAMSEATRLAEL